MYTRVSRSFIHTVRRVRMVWWRDVPFFSVDGSPIWIRVIDGRCFKNVFPKTFFLNIALPFHSDTSTAVSGRGEMGKNHRRKKKLFAKRRDGSFFLFFSITGSSFTDRASVCIPWSSSAAVGRCVCVCALRVAT